MYTKKIIYDIFVQTFFKERKMIVSVCKVSHYGELKEIGKGSVSGNVLATSLVLDGNAIYNIKGIWVKVTETQTGRVDKKYKEKFKNLYRMKVYEDTQKQ